MLILFLRTYRLYLYLFIPPFENDHASAFSFNSPSSCTASVSLSHDQTNPKNINLDFAFRDLLTQGFKWKLKLTAQIWLFNKNLLD